MNENILELLKSQLTGPILGQVAQSLGLSEGKARSGLEGAFAAVLSGLLQKAGRPGGAESLLNTIKDKGYTGELLNNLGSALGTADGTQDLLKEGSSLLHGSFGDKLESVANALSGSLGLSKGAMNSLLALAAPLVMSQIGKIASARGLNPAGLVELLMGQAKFLQSAAPPGLSSALGLNSLADLGKDVQRRAADYGSTASRTGLAAVETGIPWLKWALPACLLAALAALGIYALRPLQPINRAERQPAPAAAGRQTVPETANAPAENVKQGMADIAEGAKGTIDKAAERTEAAAERTGEKIAGAAEGLKGSVAKAVERTEAAAESLKGKLTAVTLPGGLKLNLPENSGLTHFATFLQNPKPEMSRVFALESFQYDPGTTRVSAASMDNMEILAKILKAFPSVNIKLVGHPDTVSDSVQRKAEALRRATDAKDLLVERGIDTNRIGVEGAESDAKDTKLELVVTKL